MHEILGIGDLTHVQVLKQAVVGVEPTHVGRGKGDIGFGTASQLGLVETVDGAAGHVFDLDAGLSGELLADGLVDEIAETAAPGADYQLVGSVRT